MKNGLNWINVKHESICIKTNLGGFLQLQQRFDYPEQTSKSVAGLQKNLSRVVSEPQRTRNL